VVSEMNTTPSSFPRQAGSGQDKGGDPGAADGNKKATGLASDGLLGVGRF